jgi:hypothetical protein
MSGVIAVALVAVLVTESPRSRQRAQEARGIAERIARLEAMGYRR